MECGTGAQPGPLLLCSNRTDKHLYYEHRKVLQVMKLSKVKELFVVLGILNEQV